MVSDARPWSLFKLTIPTICMMIFTSVYSIVDGFFVSNYAGKDEFTAVNFVMPVLMILGSAGFMLGSGGSARISLKRGMGDDEAANKIFSMLIYSSIVVGILLALIGNVVVDDIVYLLGGRGNMAVISVKYARIVMLALPAFLLQFEFQCLFPCAGKGRLGLYVTIAAGVCNMFLDLMLVGVLHKGFAGAAVATAISQYVGGVFPLCYFARKNSSYLRLVRAGFVPKTFVQICVNGSSELMSNISMSVVAMLYNMQLIRYAGDNGVSAYGVLMYVSMIFAAIFIGYAVGVAPVVGYNYGAKDIDKLRKIKRSSFIIISFFSVIMFFAAFFMAETVARVFVGYDKELMALTVYAFKIFSFSFLVCGFSIFTSSFFTALGDGLTSALLAFFRTLVFQSAAVLVFPIIWGVDGIWYSITAAEVMALMLSILFLKLKKAKYSY
ncbi:MAG TPA: MATE family efflux transporter [Eubacterium sp.]|nr:MATE family efflux transporter [Eubacterium sp.]HBZ52209.1 MATE family efflux transporter [Eubacterium sp.]